MCHGACTLRGRRRRRTLDASARLCSRAGAAKKSAIAPSRALALPDVHTDRARSGAARAAQGPRTGSVGRRGPRYWYEAPEAEWKYPTHAAISACATRRDPRWPISRPTQNSTHSQHILGIQSVFSELPRFTCGPSVLLTGSPAFDGHSPNHPPTTPLNRSLDKKKRGPATGAATTLRPACFMTSRHGWRTIPY